MSFLKKGISPIKPVAGAAPKAPAPMKSPVKPIGVKAPAGIKPIAPKSVKPVVPPAPVAEPEPEVIETAKEEVVEVKTPTPVVKPKIKVNNAEEVKTKEEPLQEEKPVAKATAKEKAVDEEEPKKEEVAVEAKEPEEKKEEVKEEKTVKKTRSRKSSASKKETAEPVEVDIPRNEIEYEEIISNVLVISAGESWEENTAEVLSKLKSIVIEADMNPATLRQAQADLVQLKDAILPEYIKAKSVLDAAETKLDLVKTLNAGVGSTADERKANAIRACMAYSENGYTINLFELVDIAKGQVIFYKDVIDQLEFKRGALITMNGALKLDKDAVGTHI